MAIGMNVKLSISYGRGIQSDWDLRWVRCISMGKDAWTMHKCKDEALTHSLGSDVGGVKAMK